MADIFREVDEDIRHERYQKLWRRYRWWILGVVTSLIVAVALYVMIKDRAESDRIRDGERYAEAISGLESGNPNAVALLRELADETSSGYRALARFVAAEALVRASDRKGAVLIYDELSADNTIDVLYRELAVLMAVEQLVDRENIEEITQRLVPLLGPEAPWNPLANELLGVANIRSGNVSAAQEIFTRLESDPGAPRGVRSRASEILALIGRLGAAPLKDTSVN